MTIRSVSGSSVQLAVVPLTVQSRMSSSMALSVTFTDSSTTSTAIETDPVNVAAARSGVSSTS